MRKILLLSTIAIVFLSTVHAQISSWTNTGPIAFPINVSGQVDGIGRVSQVKFHPTNPAKIYAVSASGGLFVTNDTGHNWAPTPGTEVLPQTSLSSVCIDYTNDQILYICLGDADYYSSNYGIYKSANGGTTWTASNSGIGTAMAVEILMDPTDHNKLVAATNNGIYKSTNAGASWVQTQTGVFKDMKAKPVANTATLYAVTATQAYYSTNFGSSWVLAAGFTAPSGNDGSRIAVSASDTSRVYLAVTNSLGRIYRSSNNGISYSLIYSSTTQCITCYDAAANSSTQGNYNIDLNANPANANELLLVAHCVWRSTDGGLTWSKRTSWPTEMHTDMHNIQWNPYDLNQRWCANDGGVWMSTDPLATVWTTRSDGLAATEIYHAAQSPVVRELVSIGSQDNGELYYANGIWRCNRGGDWGSRCAFDNSNNGMIYYLESGKKRTLLPLVGDQSYNNPFAATNNARIDFVQNMPGVAFTGRDSIYRSTNINTSTPSWTLIKPTTAAIRSMAVSKADSNILFVVSAGNQLLRCKNALAATPVFTTLITPGTTTNSASIATVKSNKAIVFLSCGAGIYRSADTGNTWTSITGSGLSGLNIRQIIHDDYSTNERVFVNAGSYVHYKNNTTSAWTNMSSNMGLPTVCNATDLMMYNDGSAASILRLSMYGRGVWQSNINNNLPPSIDFTADRQFVCPGDTIHFNSTIYGGYNTLAWTFAGGTPSAATSANPTVVYNTPGTYTVTLTATNANGSNIKTKTAFITVSIGQQSPIQEGFEGTIFPPLAWQQQGNNSNQWIQSTPGGYNTSNKSMMFDNYNIDVQGARISMLTPKVDLTGVTTANLSFDVAYAPYNGAQPDSLEVRISTDCGHNWTTVYSKTGTVLATASANTTNTFVPTATEWRTETVSLNSFVNNGILISFDNVGHFGQALYIDNVNIQQSPTASFAANDTTVCVGIPVLFSDSSANAAGWSWSFPGGTPVGSTIQNPTVTYNTPGFYSVTLTTNNSIGTGTKTKINYIQVYPLPTISITQAGNVLTATGSAGTYVWKLNGNPVPGATNNTYTPPSSGSYSVTVTNANGCSATSAIFNFFHTGVNNTEKYSGFEVYPNPSTGIITLKGTDITSRTVLLQCLNATGQLILKKTLTATNGTILENFDWSNLPKGIYELKLMDSDGNHKLIKITLN